ncbi:MAG: FAD-dependent monooxygenase [Hyphomicrobiaceae bacterium]
MSEPEALRFDIIVSGGSFIGQAAALALVRSLGPGLRVALIDEAKAEAADDVRASAITAGSKRLLDAIGAWADIAAHAQPVLRIALTDSRLDAGVRPILTTYDNLLDGDEPASFIVPNRALDDALASAVAATPDITIHRGRAVDLKADGVADAVVTLETGERLAAPLVVAADGRRSRLREAAGIGVVTWGKGQTGIVTRVRIELPHDATATQHFLPSGPFAILPLPGDRACITWSERADTAREILAMDDAAFLAEIDRRAGGRFGVLTLDGPRQSWPLSTQLARAYVARRLALVGDAVHGVHPIAGQGINLGLRDVAALVEVLVDAARVGLDLGDATTLARYERWRRFDSWMSAATFEGLNRLFSNDITLLRSIREAGLGLVDRMPGLKRLLVREAAGLTGRVPMLLKGEVPC